jgi:hypothetical protein
MDAGTQELNVRQSLEPRNQLGSPRLQFTENGIGGFRGPRRPLRILFRSISREDGSIFLQNAIDSFLKNFMVSCQMREVVFCRPFVPSWPAFESIVVNTRQNRGESVELCFQAQGNRIARQFVH